MFVQCTYSTYPSGGVATWSTNDSISSVSSCNSISSVNSCYPPSMSTRPSFVSTLVRLVAELRSSRRSLVEELRSLTHAVDRLTFLVATDLTRRNVNTQAVTTALLRDKSFLRPEALDDADDPSPADLEGENLAALALDDETLARADLLEAAERAAGRTLSDDEREDLLQAWVEDVREAEIARGRPSGPAPIPVLPGTTGPEGRRASTRGGIVPYIP